MRKKTKGQEKKIGRWDEFECSECDAHNPWGDGFKAGEEVFCSWCGAHFLVKDGAEPNEYKLKQQ